MANGNPPSGGSGGSRDVVFDQGASVDPRGGVAMPPLVARIQSGSRRWHRRLYEPAGDLRGFAVGNPASRRGTERGPGNSQPRTGALGRSDFRLVRTRNAVFSRRQGRRGGNPVAKSFCRDATVSWIGPGRHPVGLWGQSRGPGHELHCARSRSGLFPDSEPGHGDSSVGTERLRSCFPSVSQDEREGGSGSFCGGYARDASPS